MSLWEDFTLKQEKGIELKFDDLQMPTKETYVYLICYTQFGGVCNEEEIKQITKIVYDAYLRKGE